jgi:hypothetical protein
MFFSLIYGICILLSLDIVASAPLPVPVLFRASAVGKAINLRQQPAALNKFAHAVHTVAVLNRIGKKGPHDAVAKIRPKDWPHHEVRHDGTIMIHPDPKNGLSYFTHPPSVVSKKDAHYAVGEQHFGGTGLQVVHDGGKKVDGVHRSEGHATLAWAGSDPIHQDDLKQKINDVHEKFGTKTPGTSKERSNTDKAP